MPLTRARASHRPPKVSKKDPTRPVVREADKILQEVRGRALYMIPFRLMSHIPGHDALIRPVDTLRVSLISTGIGSSGFRRHEPCCINDPMPEIGVPMYILGGNHRHASTRDSGQVLIPTNRVSTKHIQSLMRLLKQEDQLLVDAGLLQAHYTDHDQALCCIEILTTTLQGLEPAPKPLTCLQQVQLLRTATRNDPILDFLHAPASSYGHVPGLRARIFPGQSGTDDSSIHFLLNKKMGDRHMNKLLAGARILIGTENKFTVAEIPDRKSILDVLVHWEAKGFMGPFLGTHLSYVGLMSETSVHAIMENMRQSIAGGNFRVTPFNTGAFKLHVGGSTSKTKSKTSWEKSPVKFHKRKAKASETHNEPVEAQERIKSRKTSKVPVPSDANDINQPEGRIRPLDLNSAKCSDVPASGTEKTEGVGVMPSALLKKSNASDDVSTEAVNPNISQKPTKINEMTGNVMYHKNENEKLRLALQNAQKIQEEAVKAAIEEERRASKQKHEAELRAATQNRTTAPDSGVMQNRNEIEALQKKFDDFRIQKEKELADAKENIESQLQSQREDYLKQTLDENNALRLKLQRLERREVTDDKEMDSRLKEVMAENAKLKKQMEALTSAGDSVRRTPRARIPTDKVLESLSPEALQQLKRKIEMIQKGVQGT